MREPNDDRIARECAADIDAVLGGHDHHYVAKTVEGVPILKSGTEFRWASKAIFEVPGGGGRPKVTWETIDVVKDMPVDPEMMKLVQDVEDKLGESMDVEIGENIVDLEGRFLWVRSRETNLGNLICDLLRIASGADICMLNGGTLRSDMVHKPGKLLFRDLVKILPLLDETCVLEMKGKDIKTALENACSQYPKLEGRFAQVSGLSYTFDADKPKGDRVVKVEIPMGTPMEDEKLYKVNTKEYLSKGKDGYDVFKDQKVLQSGEEAPIIPTTMRNHLLTLEVLNTMTRGSMGSTKSVHEKALNSFKKKSKSMTERLLVEAEEGAKDGKSRLAGKHPLTGQLCLAPGVEGRIITLNPADESKMTR